MECLENECYIVWYIFIELISNIVEMEQTSLFYMANLGSEVNRIFSLKEKGLSRGADAAYARAAAIVEKLLSHTELAGRTQEIQILKNYLESSFRSESAQFFKKELQGYFTPYASRFLSVR